MAFRRPFKGTIAHKNVWMEIDGIKFQSKKEARRYEQLKFLLDRGQISDLRLQVRFPVYINERLMFTYVCDFVYKDNVAGEIVEDVKGVKTDIYLLKKKIVEAVYDIKLLES